MPELPEVETIVRGLKPELSGKKVRQFIFLSPHLRKKQPNSALAPGSYEGKRIKDIWRRGKMIIFSFVSHEGLLVHLKMTGQLYLARPVQPVDKHTHARMTFSGLEKELRFRDIRKFGYLNCLKMAEIKERVFADLGPEPLELKFGDFSRLLKEHHKKRIKGWLLDQKIIAGIGNIYSDEMLFRAGIHPERQAGCLSQKEARKLYLAMKAVLREGIRLKGSSISDYVDSYGEKGEFQKFHRIYGKEGESCPHCQSTVRRKKISGRSSYFCPVCQPLKPVKG
jgi:formamidopyrimidine-DNA glycosylase